MKWSLTQQIVIDAEDRQQFPREGGFAVDDLNFENCAYGDPSSTCSADYNQCNSGQCYLKTQECNFFTDCCDGTDEDGTRCGKIIVVLPFLFPFHPQSSSKESNIAAPDMLQSKIVVTDIQFSPGLCCFLDTIVAL